MKTIAFAALVVLGCSSAPPISSHRLTRPPTITV